MTRPFKDLGPFVNFLCQKAAHIWVPYELHVTQSQIDSLNKTVHQLLTETDAFLDLLTKADMTHEETVKQQYKAIVGNIAMANEQNEGGDIQWAWGIVKPADL